MYRQTDTFYNIMLENTKDYRQAEVDQKKQARLERARQHSLARNSQMVSTHGSMMGEGLSPLRGGGH